MEPGAIQLSNRIFFRRIPQSDYSEMTNDSLKTLTVRRCNTVRVRYTSAVPSLVC